jgi:transcription antitermination factor NusG
MTENWYLAEVAGNREAVVAYTLRCLDLEAFLPLILQMERISQRTKQRELVARPTLPGYVFFKAEPNQVQDVNAIRDVKGIFKSPQGEFVTVPPRQMVPFMVAHDQWHIEAREAYRRGRKIKGVAPKPKFRKLTREVLEDFIRTNFRGDSIELSEVA